MLHIIGFSQIFPTLLPNLDSHKYSLYKPHKLSWAPLTHITHILSNLGFLKNTHHITTKIGPQNYTISAKKAQKHLPYGKIQNPL